MRNENAARLQTVSEFQINVEQINGYEFRVRFDKEQYPELLMDEPAPLGKDTAPNPSRVLSAAIGNCLSASLLFCATKLKIDIGPVRTAVRTQLGRNQNGRLRIAKITVDIDPHIKPEDGAKAQRCLALFEDYCVVTQSVRDGIEVEVNVKAG